MLLRMFKLLLRRVSDVVMPFRSIAQELRLLRELYELDLAHRDPPVRRVTEKPNRYDTEITYGEVDEKDAKLQELYEKSMEE